jgi:hypothetical protein
MRLGALGNKNLHAKLGVGNRTAAVAASRSA